ncbi:MAG: chromosomal replication initiator protein DnaA [Muribaculaceae bacterium]|nr:chromosomal replication initiator protein DnaA [Muribaculaceae bacterium]
MAEWTKCLEIFKDNLPAEQYDAWFKPITAISLDGDKLTLQVPSFFFVEHIEQRYLHLLRSTLTRVFGADVKLYYKYNMVKNDDDSGVTFKDDKPSTVLVNKVQTQTQRPSNPFVTEDFEDIDPQLNPRYTFDNYCASTSNKLPVSIAKAIAEDPKCKTFNPLFVFGTTGVGKTHLIQAIGIRIKELNPRSRVLYVTARIFENQYQTAVRSNKVPDFINFYQSIDVLILDDIQELAGKQGTQNTFFHIFNQLHQQQKQLILSSDSRPADMDGMMPRLISRFKWGMTVELPKPDYELRREVLEMKAAQDGLQIDDEVLDYIAANVTTNIRELEGVVISLLAHATMLNQDITIDLARAVISNSVKLNKKQITFEMITETVAKYYNLDTDMLFGKTRKREISDARQLVMYLAKKETQMSSTNIGSRLSRNHATVLHACKQVEQRISIEKKFQKEVEKIEMSLRN